MSARLWQEQSSLGAQGVGDVGVQLFEVFELSFLLFGSSFVGLILCAGR